MVQMYAVVVSYLVNLKDRREEGQGMVEYALIIALVSVVAIGILTTLGGNITSKLTEASNAL